MYELLVAMPRLSKQKESLADIRKSGFVPAVIYGKEAESLSIKIQTADLLRVFSKDNQIFELKVGQGKKFLVHVENIQRDVLKGSILHLSLKTIKKGEKTVVPVPVVILGVPLVEESQIVIELASIELQGLPQDIPNNVEIDVSGLKVGDDIRLAKVKVPVGVKFVDKNLEQVVVRCLAAEAE